MDKKGEYDKDRASRKVILPKIDDNILIEFSADFKPSNIPNKPGPGEKKVNNLSELFGKVAREKLNKYLTKMIQKVLIQLKLGQGCQGTKLRED